MHNLCWINDNIPNSQMRPEILQQMLQTVLNIIMFEDCRLTLPRISFNSGLLSNLLSGTSGAWAGPCWALSSSMKITSRWSFGSQWKYFFLLLIFFSSELARPSNCLSTSRQEGGHDDLVWFCFNPPWDPFKTVLQVWKSYGGDRENLVDKEQRPLHSEPFSLPQGH